MCGVRGGVGAPPHPTTPILHRHVTASAVQLFLFVFAILSSRVQHGRARTAQARRPAAQGRREQAEDRQRPRHQRLQVGVSASRVRRESGRLESLGSRSDRTIRPTYLAHYGNRTGNLCDYR